MEVCVVFYMHVYLWYVVCGMFSILLAYVLTVYGMWFEQSFACLCSYSIWYVVCAVFCLLMYLECVVCGLYRVSFANIL